MRVSFHKNKVNKTWKLVSEMVDNLAVRKGCNYIQPKSVSCLIEDKIGEGVHF